MAKSEKFTMKYLGDKTFFHPEGFRKPNQPPVFLAAICLAEVAPGAGEVKVHVFPECYDTLADLAGNPPIVNCRLL